MELSLHLQSHERLRPSKEVTRAYKENPKVPAASQREEVKIIAETKNLPLLPASDASSEDEASMEEKLMPDEWVAPTIEDEAFEAQTLKIMKDQEKSKELVHSQQKNVQDKRNRRNAPPIVQHISITNNVNFKYGPDHSRHATNYGPSHDHSRHSTQNETHTDCGPHMGTSDGKIMLRAPSVDGKCWHFPIARFPKPPSSGGGYFGQGSLDHHPIHGRRDIPNLQIKRVRCSRAAGDSRWVSGEQRS